MPRRFRCPIRLAGQETKGAWFVQTLPFSGAIFIRTFPRECTETLLEGHRRTFEDLGGVPRRIAERSAANNVDRLAYLLQLCELELIEREHKAA